MFWRPVKSDCSAGATPRSVGLERAITEPSVGDSPPEIMRSRVDFPEPLTPTSPIDSPSSATNVTPLTARTTFLLEWSRNGVEPASLEREPSITNDLLTRSTTTVGCIANSFWSSFTGILPLNALGVPVFGTPEVNKTEHESGRRPRNEASPALQTWGRLI